MSDENLKQTPPAEGGVGQAPEKEAPAAKPAPKPAAAPVPEPVPLVDDPLRKMLDEFFPGSVREASVYLGQRFYDLEGDNLPGILEWFRVEQGFDLLADVTALDFPDREKRFTIIYNLYSIAKHDRVILRHEVADGEPAPSASRSWPAAVWPEREVFDLFGIQFEGNPDMRRILLPEGWKGHPLRKDYDLRGRDTEWVSNHMRIIRED